MSLFDGDFDVEDATIVGGIMGFASEAFKDESAELEEDFEEIEINPKDLKEPNLRLIYNNNPGLFNYVVNVVRKQNKEWKEARLAREAVMHELEAMAACERMLEEDSDETN